MVYRKALKKQAALKGFYRVFVWFLVIGQFFSEIQGIGFVICLLLAGFCAGAMVYYAD